MSTFTTNSEVETKNWASKLAKQLPKGGFICLHGELGSGKTVFSKGFAKALGIKENAIKSPTYTFVREYDIQRGSKKGKLYHFDFYRIEELDELMETDLRDIFGQKNSWILVEWPERIERILPANRIDIHLEYMDATTRQIKVKTR